MFRYAPRMSQGLKDHIWAQLNLGYMTKQIYDKHKSIWWERVNTGQSMTRDDFIWLQDIAYLDQKHKKGSWCLHTNPAISIQFWAFQHPEDVFFFQDLGEINGTQVPFTINIGLVMCGQIISRLITINLVNDNIYHGLVFKILL